MVKAYANGILVGGTYYVAPATVTLADGSDNTETITGADGYVADVTLSGRTLYKDGAWNTICLPFNVTLDSSPLAGAAHQRQHQRHDAHAHLRRRRDDA